MALTVPDLEFVDPFGGANDLNKRVLRTPVGHIRASTMTRCA